MANVRDLRKSEVLGKCLRKLIANFTFAAIAVFHGLACHHIAYFKDFAAY